jgi:hypothetical protein
MPVSQEDLLKSLDDTFTELRDLLLVKGGEYAPGADALVNFKETRDGSGIPTLSQVWLVFATKHWRSIQNYIKDQVAGVERQRSESINGRINDLINYLLLLKVIIASGEDRKPGYGLTEESRQRLRDQLAKLDPPPVGIGTQGETWK